MAKRKKKRLLRIGVTGGIGGGKSAVCDIFRKLGAPVLSADEIARKLTETNAGIKKSIQEDFGSEVFTESGSLNRKKIAEVVFSDKKKRGRLNAIIHPYVLQKINREVHRLEEDGEAPFVIHEAALIYEAGADKDLDYVLVVDADEEERIRRVMKRDGVSRDDVLKRIRSQMSAQKKKELAHFVLVNDGDMKDLEKKVTFFYKLFSKIGENPSSLPS